MLINGWSGSGGDAFPYYFRQAGLGKLIGRRTWGGLVGISGQPALVDGASPTVPRFAFYELDGTWGVEGHGVDPDIEVLDDPALMVDGSDPQLEAAIRHLQGELESWAFQERRRPAGPDRSGTGLAPADR
jgi:tricorn protease